MPRALRVAAIVVMLLVGAPSAHADHKPGAAGHSTGGGAKVIITMEQIRAAKDEAAKAAAAAAAGKPVPHWEYKTHINCVAGNTNTDDGCGTAAAACTNGQFQAVVLRRLLNPDGTPVTGPQGSWSEWGVTCFPQLLPGNTVPSLAMILQAFREVDFAKGDLSIQPVGNVTLVNLPTFFEAKWPEVGVGPDEIHETPPLLGYRLEIQAIARSITYVYGDGNSSEPTKSLGGPHPSGDIRWTYTKPGVMPARLDTTYGGRFRLDGGQWITIPDTVTVQGTPVNLTVREAKARLYDNG